MLEWIFWLVIVLTIVFLLVAYFAEIPMFYALAGLVLFLGSLTVMIDEGIERETVANLTQIGATDNYQLTYTYDANSTISTSFDDDPIMWSLNNIAMFLGFLFMGYAIALYAEGRKAIGEKAKGSYGV